MALVLEKPNFVPYICMVCGIGDDRRKWYVDLQLAGIEIYLNPVNDGAVYLCNECWEGLAKSVAEQAQVMLFGNEPWAIGEYVEPTYDNETVIEVTHVERRSQPGNTDVEVIHRSDVELHPVNEGDNSEPESNDPVTDDNDPEPDATGDDESGESLSGLGTFFESR